MILVRLNDIFLMPVKIGYILCTASDNIFSHANYKPNRRLGNSPSSPILYTHNHGVCMSASSDTSAQIITTMVYVVMFLFLTYGCGHRNGLQKLWSRRYFTSSSRDIGISFQLAITTPRLNLIGYGTATAQSWSEGGLQLLIYSISWRNTCGFCGVVITKEFTAMNTE